jgi:3-methyl-2-oxobutanoate hydroxymethyltransferase
MKGIQMNVHDFIRKKSNNIKIKTITCYDYTSARIVASTDIDMILVGDSVANTIHGHTDTTTADINMLALHTKAVKTALLEDKSKIFLVSDLPFMYNRGSLDRLTTSSTQLIQSGANAIKIEGGDEANCNSIKHLINSGIPVMGHIGLTPQLVNTIGGYKVQGKTEKQANELLSQALNLESAGCFAIVLECIPSYLAKKISMNLSIPTIGIGAGPDTDGQILVIQDLLGMNKNFTPKFAKKYMNGYQLAHNAIQAYCSEVTNRNFPDKEHSFIGKQEENTEKELAKLY